MAYTRQNLKDGQCLCAHHLKAMEDALCDMPCVEKARVGQVLAVAEVDLTGKPKSYAAVDMEGGGGGTSWNDLEDRPFYTEGQKFEPIIFPDSFYNTETEEWYSDPIDLGALFGVDSMIFHIANVQVSDVENYIGATYNPEQFGKDNHSICFDYVENDILPEGMGLFEGRVWGYSVASYGDIEDRLDHSFIIGIVSKENEYGLPIGVYSNVDNTTVKTRGVIYNDGTVRLDEKYMPTSFDELLLKINKVNLRVTMAGENVNEIKSKNEEIRVKTNEAWTLANEAESLANEAESRANLAASDAGFALTAADNARVIALEASAKATEIEERLVNGELGGKEPLVGTYAEITPTEVLEAISQGRAVTVIYADPTYGVIVFTGFTALPEFKVIVSSDIAIYYNQYINVELIGNIDSNMWSLLGEPMAKVSDIPEIPDSLPNPYTLTFTGAVSGTYDGSSATIINVPNGGDTIPDYVKTEADRVAKVVQSHQNENTISFFACSDLHYSQIQSHAPQQLAALTHMGQGMKLIREKVKIDFGVMLGDMIWDVGETQETGLEEIRFVNERLSEGFGNLPQIRSRGNHEDGYESGINFSKSQIFANVGIFNKGAVYDNTNRVGGYCYRDFEDAKLRVICLNSSEEGGCIFSSAQVTWLASALDLSEKGHGWRSIILSHHPIDWGKSGGIDPTSTIKTAKGVIGTFHGHIHNFLVGTLTGTELSRIAIPNAGYTRENQYGTSYGINWKEDTTYSKTPGTAEDTSFCIVTIDFKDLKIYLDHYGAGYDREVTFVDTAEKAYNNLVPTSIDPSTGGVYNSVGYKDGCYASGQNEGTDAAYVLTGLIPYGNGVTTPIYIKGADVTSESHCRILGFASDKKVSVQSAAGSSLATYFTVETLGTSYYKVTPTSSWTSASGFKDYIRLSLKGTGANLIITLNEPIE